MINRQSRLNNLPVGEETPSSSSTAKMNKMNKLLSVEQLLGIGMIIVMTILLWGDWVVLTLLYIPFVGVLILVNVLTWLQASKDTTE